MKTSIILLLALASSAYAAVAPKAIVKIPLPKTTTTKKTTTTTRRITIVPTIITPINVISSLINKPPVTPTPTIVVPPVSTTTTTKQTTAPTTASRLENFLADRNPTDQVDPPESTPEPNDGFGFDEKWQQLNPFNTLKYKGFIKTVELPEKTSFTGVYQELDSHRSCPENPNPTPREIDLPLQGLLLQTALDAVDNPGPNGGMAPVRRSMIDPENKEAISLLYEMLKRMSEFDNLHSFGASPKGADGPAVGQKSRRYIFGTDDRTRVGNSNNFPYRAVGMVGNHCTGTLIGPRHVLTAGHCVHSGPGGDWIANLNFRPSLNNENGVPPGGRTYAWAGAVTLTAWTLNKDWESDFALITLAEEPNVGYMSFGWHNGISNGWGFNINGYPGDKPWGQMWHHYCPIVDARTNQLRHRCDTVPGTSGSGMYVLFSDSGLRRIYGVNNVAVKKQVIEWPLFWNWHWEPDYNAGVRITQSRFARICGWMATPSVC